MEQSTKLLGGISYIVLIVFGILGVAATPFLEIISLIAVICLLIAFYRAGGELGRPDEKRDITIAIIAYIVALILLDFFAGGPDIVSWVLTIIGWILIVVGAWFWYQASVALTEAGGGSLFKPGGLLILIGAVVMIILGIIGIAAPSVGFLIVIAQIVMWIGFLLQAIAFFMAPGKALA
jgi:uncharacterized membrane protein